MLFHFKIKKHMILLLRFIKCNYRPVQPKLILHERTTNVFPVDYPLLNPVTSDAMWIDYSEIKLNTYRHKL